MLEILTGFFQKTKGPSSLSAGQGDHEDILIENFLSKPVPRRKVAVPLMAFDKHEAYVRKFFVAVSDTPRRFQDDDGVIPRA
jgi:hypothetical protein